MRLYFCIRFQYKKRTIILSVCIKYSMCNIMLITVREPRSCDMGKISAAELTNVVDDNRAVHGDVNSHSAPVIVTR